MRQPTKRETYLIALAIGAIGGGISGLILVGFGILIYELIIRG